MTASHKAELVSRPGSITEVLASRVQAARADLIRVGILALLSMVIWCTIYNRWSAANWHIPLSYLADPLKGDAIQQLATIRAAKDGHVLPILFTNIPELGAPYVANWDDYPSTEKLMYLMLGIAAHFVGTFAAANFAAMLADVLASISFYAACRLLNCGWIWSFAGAFVFAFARFGFAHEIHHIPTAYVWHLPLCLVVCRWVIDGEGIAFRSERFVIALVVAFFTGIQSPYNTNMFAQFMLIGGLVQWWRRKDWNAAFPAIAIVGALVATFLFVNANTFLYHFVHGSNPGAVVRAYKWLEIYALKVVDMVVPPPDHRFALFAAWGTHHFAEVLLSPGELPPTAYIGLVGIGTLAWLTVVSFKQVLESSRLPLETWQILWILLYSDVGGINGILGTLGFQLFRSTTRYSIWILCIVLMYAVRRLSAMDFKNKVLTYSIASLAAIIALWDQMPPQVTAGELQETAGEVASDRNFTAKMEERLPPNAMVFQIPIMEFPESPAPGVGSYDHFRPYLYSHHLRFSFGSDKGRPREYWQKAVGALPSLDALVARLESYGFSAIYVNRSGFPDKGESIIKTFQQIGRPDMIQSDRGDLVCVFLKPALHPELPDDHGGLYY